MSEKPLKWTSNVKCDVCLWDDKDEVLYGDWLSEKGINVHYLCLLSSKIPQRGNKNNSVQLYRPEDIMKAVQNIRDIKCHYCTKKSAAIQCAHEGCDRWFHYPCGTRNNCMTGFSEDFKSFCNRHVPDQNEGKSHKCYTPCTVCTEMLGTYHQSKSIISSCCLHSDDWESLFVHKHCVMQYVKNAGYDSMCINCDMNDENLTKEMWQSEMRSKGIFIPFAPATWENEGRFDNQVKNKCEMIGCCNPHITKDVWTCYVCGCHPRHLQCFRVAKPEQYICCDCFDQSFVARVPIL